MSFEAVIGLEVHAQLLTKSKIFCSCSTTFGAEPNSNICPICTGMPGVLPVLNRKVVDFTIKMAKATGGEVAGYSRFARKNYFYPDLPKGYQISQYELPLSKGGYIDIETKEGGKKRIALTRIHLEEDAGKLIHGENLGDRHSSYVDYNRAGVPLIEIVSEPEISTPEEAKEYLSKLKTTLEYLEICDCNMEEGSLRCDANISIRKKGEKKLGTKTELKNMNSFRNVQRAIEYEIDRQIKVTEEGGVIRQETRLWDADREVTVTMRSKEEAHDYRYYPEPDLVPITVDSQWISDIEKDLPELPDIKRGRFVKEYHIPEYDASVLTSSKSLSQYFEEAVKLFPEAKTVSNWIMGDLLRELKDKGKEINESPVTPLMLGEMLAMIKSGVISGKIAKTVFEEMYNTGKRAEDIVKAKGLIQISDQGAINTVIDEIIKNNKENLERYKSGQTKLFGFFVGEVMKATKGKANPVLVNEILKGKLDG